ncbi:MAG: extracellular solute-binding protein [Spirochaetaceae bacterium]|jgi:lactose/L-arabinose transport system substrate-binding protein|nr:extracellular solute-binding protein [Spirochaetaceae bacterium]
MKKILFVLALCAAVLCACSKKEGAAVDPNAPVSLNVWCWDPTFNVFAMNEAGKIYNASHPNVSVNVIETPWNDLQQKLITSLSANQTSTLPDIVLIQDNAVQKNVMNFPKAFYPINGKIDVKQFAPFKVDVGLYEGKNYSIPFDNGTTASFLRSDVLEKAGLKASDFKDISWERFIELGKTVKEKTGVALVSTVANEPDYIMIMLQSAGTWFFTPDGKVNLKNNAVLKKSMELFAEMVKSGVCILVTDWNAYIATLNNGSAAGTIQGCWILGSIMSEKSQAGKWTMTNTPKFSDIDSVNYSNQGGSSWLILSSSKNREIALDFMNATFAGSTDLYNTILPSSGAIGTWLPAAEAPAYGAPNDFFGGQKIYEELVDYASKTPLVKYGAYNYEARDAVARALSDYLGGMALDTALETAQKNVEFLMGE